MMGQKEAPFQRPLRQWAVSSVDEVCRTRLVDELDCSRLAASLLLNRGICDPVEAHRFVNPSLHDLPSPFLMPGMAKAVDRILQAVLQRERILIYGDYDVDGLTSTALLARFLRASGADPVCYVPDRLLEGYGFHEEALPAFSKQGIQLIITVDCGISAVRSVECANRADMDVIVTDHHECSGGLPPALAVLNPKIPGSAFPFRDLAGVGVAFFLVMALRRRFREFGLWKHILEPNLVEYLDLVTLGTLADMVPLTGENRILVKFGLQELAKGRRPGIFVMKEMAGIEGEIRQIRPIVFRIIPRMNAPGRLGCSRVSLDILMTDDLGDAKEIAKVLEQRNVERKGIEEKVYRQAWNMARKQMETEPSVLVLAEDGWHKGILGIVASRIAQEFQKPTVLVSFEGDLGRGSVRSFDNFEILDSVLACGMLLENAGGHRMAAGISLRRDRLIDFRTSFEEVVRGRLLSERAGPPGLRLDAWVDAPGDLNDRLMDELDRMAPFGHGNEEPVLGMRNVKIAKRTIVGANHLKLVLEAGSHRFESIGFGMGHAGEGMDGRHSSWDVAFTPERDRWRGRGMLGLRLVDIRPS